MTPEEAKRLSVAEQHEWFRAATSRRSLLRGGVIGAGAAIAGPAILSGTASAATASPAKSASPLLLAKAHLPSGGSVAPFGKHLAFGADPTTSMAIAWQVPALVSNPFIRIGHSPHDLSEQIPAEIRSLTTQPGAIQSVDSVPPSASGDSIEQFYVHARISGLRPGKTYYYSVGHSGWDFSGDVASLGSFTTAPDENKKPFTFTAFGDEGVTYDAVGNTNLIRAQAPAFLDFIVAYFHHCAYSTCSVHGSEGGAEQFFAPVFDQYQVDLVINGHNHIYERTDPIRGGNAATTAPIGSTVHPATDGTTYICAGGGGVSLYDFPVADSYEGHVDNLASVPTFINVAGGNTTNVNVTWSRVRYTGYCLLVMTSNPRQSRHGTSSLQLRGLAENGSELDSITIVR